MSNMSNWDTVRLQEVADINPESLTASTPRDFQFRYIDIASVNKGVINWQLVTTQTFGTAPSRARRVVRPKDFLLCTVRPALQAHCFADWQEQNGFICSTGFAVVRVREPLEPHFFKHVAFSSDISRQLRQLETGSNYPAVNEHDIRFLRIPLPSFPEQQRIAEILDTIDTTIQRTEALIAKLKAAKAGLLHDLLTRGLDENGQLRDPERNPELFKNTSLGVVPVTWEVVSINDIAIHVGSGATPRGGSNVYQDEGILFIRSQNVSFDGLKLTDVAFISPATHSKMLRSEVFPYDVLLNITGASIGRCTWVPANIGSANVNQHVCIIRLPQANKWDAVFLSTVLSSPIGQSQIDKLNAGGNREGLNYQQLRSFVIPWPARQERAQIANAVELHEERVRTEEAQLAKLHQLKRGLMEDLLTGRVRVPLAQPEAAQAEAVN